MRNDPKPQPAGPSPSGPAGPRPGGPAGPSPSPSGPPKALQLVSPFDGIRRVDERGEHWLARELQPLMAYVEWRDFAKIVERAKASAKNAGQDAEQAFWEIAQKVPGSRPRQEYRLTRYAAYLVAMNGDPNKREVAEAQAYFAARTREAELAEQVDLDDPLKALAQQTQRTAQAIQIALDERERRQIAEQKIALDAPKVKYVDAFVKTDDCSQVGDLATHLGVQEKQLRAFLIERGVVYKRHIGKRWSMSQQKRVDEWEWRPRAKYAAWFHVKDQANAPRFHNGQLRTTMYVTPPGKVGISKLVGTYSEYFGGAA